jgi:hypothetical protein
MMRAWNAQGHRLRALQHYERLAAWLAAEFETDPEPETAELAERLRSRAASPSSPLPEPALVRAPRPAPRTLPRMEPAARHPAAPLVRARVHWAWGGVAGVAVLLALLWNSGALLGRGWGPEADPADPPPALHPALAAPGSPATWLADWLRTDGRWIYYRYELWMPGACDHPTMAVGSWGPDGWSVGSPVHCIDHAWLALDVERLAERFPLAPETTYCINFRYVTGNTTHWGQHGAEGAPGLNDIRVVAPDGSYNIGFAIVRQGPGKRRVHFTNAYPGPRC